MKTLLILILLTNPSFVFSGDSSDKESCGPMSSEACVIFNITNQERVRHRLKPLEFCRPCWKMAQEHSEDMKKRGYFSHDRPASKRRTAETFSERSERFGLSHRAGENIARSKDGVTAMEMWMDSRAHRENILNPEYRYLGVGYYQGHFTQVFWKGERSSKDEP